MQVGRQPGGEDLALEALLDQHGNPAGVVDVGVGHQHVVDAIGREGKLRIADLVPPLLQTAVHQDASCRLPPGSGSCRSRTGRRRKS